MILFFILIYFPIILFFNYSFFIFFNFIQLNNKIQFLTMQAIKYLIIKIIQLNSRCSEINYHSQFHIRNFLFKISLKIIILNIY